MVSVILFIVAGFFNSIMDTIRYRWNKSYFSSIKNEKLKEFCDPTLSQGRKYKHGNPANGPAFCGSTTIFVWVTDLWHLVKGLMLVALCFGTTMYHPIIDVWVDPLLLITAFGGTFELFFGHLWIRRT